MEAIEIIIEPYLENTFDVTLVYKKGDEVTSKQDFIVHTDSTKFRKKIIIDGNPTMQERMILKAIFRFN
jgi:hypothetical protein